MQKTLGVIAEYDPFHKGHAYHLEEAKRLSGAERTVCVISGPFAQRGDPAFFDKYVRAEAAVRGGADLVLELPFVYAATGAENFARGGVRILAGLGVCDAIAFGSERARETPGTAIEELKKIAHLLAFETKEFSEKIKESLAQGLSFPAARQNAIAAVLGENYAALTHRPNDILGVEYLKQWELLSAERLSRGMICFHPLALLEQDKIKPLEFFAIPRFDAEAGRESEAPEDFIGANGIRTLLKAGFLDKALTLTAEKAEEVFQDAIIAGVPEVSAWKLKSGEGYNFDFSAVSTRGNVFVYPEDLFDALRYALINMEPKAVSEIYSAAEGIENRLFEAASSAESYEQLIAFVKSKRYTETRIKRFFLHVAIGLSKSEMEASFSERICPRVLAFNDVGAEILRDIKESSPEVYVFQNMRQEEDELARSRISVSAGVRADKLYRMLGKGSLAGFRYSPEPRRV